MMKNEFVRLSFNIEMNPGPDEIEITPIAARNLESAERKAATMDGPEAEEFLAYSVWPIDKLIEHLIGLKTQNVSQIVTK